MYFVYAIKSEFKDWIYVGISNDIDRRLKQHNAGYNRSTKPYRPFKLIYSEKLSNRISARKREQYLKSTSGKRFLRRL